MASMTNLLPKFMVMGFLRAWSVLFYIFRWLTDRKKKGGKAGFTEMDVGLMAILRNMAGSGLAGLYSMGTLQQFAWKLRYLRLVESGLFDFAARFPKLFSRYTNAVLYPALRSGFTDCYDENVLYLVHNFCGARLTALAAVMDCLTKGKDVCVITDGPAFRFCRYWASRMGAEIEKQGEGSLSISVSEWIPGCRNRVFVLLAGSVSALRFGMRLFRGKKANWIVIPETPGGKGGTSIPFLKGRLVLPRPLRKIIQIACTIVSVIPDIRDGILLPELSVEINCPGRKDGGPPQSFFRARVSGYESFVRYNPFLYVPFENSDSWSSLFEWREREKNNSMVFDIERKSRHLTLWSDGRVFVMDRRQFREVRNYLTLGR